MKKEINKIFSSILKKDEISIFRAMELSLNKKTNSIYVKETHSSAGFVEYISPNCPIPVKKEIADLMIVSHNTKNKENRLCFLQAKYHRNKIKPFLKFRGDFYQWELLKTRPMIKSVGKSDFPKDILSFTNYKSISSFGVFYHDNNSKIDMLFSIPDILKPLNIKTHKNRPSTTLIFPGLSKCPKNNCFRLINQKEIMTTCNLDMFEKLLLCGLVGAPITGIQTVEGYLYKIINKILRTTDNYLLDVIFDSLHSTDTSNLDTFEIPNVLFVLTNDETKL